MLCQFGKARKLRGKVYVSLCGLEPKRRLDSFHVFLSMPCFPLVLKNDYSVMMSFYVQYHYLLRNEESKFIEIVSTITP